MSIPGPGISRAAALRIENRIQEVAGTPSSLLMANGSEVRQGTTDAGRGGNGGVSLICSVGYEFKWEAGWLYLLQNGSQVRGVQYCTDTPQATDDADHGFAPGSFWVMEDGTTFLCEDATAEEAIWRTVNTGKDIFFYVEPSEGVTFEVPPVYCNATVYLETAANAEIILPVGAFDGQKITILTDNAIADFTLSMAGQGTILNNPTSVPNWSRIEAVQVQFGIWRCHCTAGPAD